MSQSVWAAITRYHSLGRRFIDNRNLLLTVQEAEIRVPACWVLARALRILTWQRVEGGSKLSHDSYNGSTPIPEGSTP